MEILIVVAAGTGVNIEREHAPGLGPTDVGPDVLKKRDPAHGWRPSPTHLICGKRAGRVKALQGDHEAACHKEGTDGSHAQCISQGLVIDRIFL